MGVLAVTGEGGLADHPRALLVARQVDGSAGGAERHGLGHRRECSDPHAVLAHGKGVGGADGVHGRAAVGEVLAAEGVAAGLGRHQRRRLFAGTEGDHDFHRLERGRPRAVGERQHVHAAALALDRAVGAAGEGFAVEREAAGLGRHQGGGAAVLTQRDFDRLGLEGRRGRRGRRRGGDWGGLVAAASGEAERERDEGAKQPKGVPRVAVHNSSPQLLVNVRREPTLPATVGNVRMTAARLFPSMVAYPGSSRQAPVSRMLSPLQMSCAVPRYCAPAGANPARHHSFQPLCAVQKYVRFGRKAHAAQAGGCTVAWRLPVWDVPGERRGRRSPRQLWASGVHWLLYGACGQCSIRSSRASRPLLSGPA